MARSGQFSFEGRSGTAEWTFDGSYLVLTPEAGAPLSFPVPELAGITGDGYTLVLTVTGAAVSGTGTLGSAGTRAAPARRA